MHKYYLSFQDEKLENQYQSNWQLGDRFTKFSIFTKAYIICFIGKCLTHILDGNFKLLYFSLSMLILVILQGLFLQKTNQYMRKLAVVSNLLMTIYYQIVEENVDPAQAHLKGANQMGSNFLLILTNEFPEALIQICAIGIIRITCFVLRSNIIDFSPIISLFTLSTVWVYVLYEFHKKTRSQFLRTIVNQQWDNILRQLLRSKSYVLLHFNEENLQYEEIISNNFNSSFESKYEMQNFLNQALYKKQPLRDYIHQQIQQYNKVRLDQFNIELQVKFQQYLAIIELSIFFGSKPTILLVFPQFKKAVNKQENVYLKFIAQILKQMRNKFIQEKAYTKLSKKITFAQNLETIHNAQPTKLDLITLISKVISFFPDLKIEVFSPQEFEIETMNEILTLFCLTVLQYTINQDVKIFIFLNKYQVPEIKFRGKFQPKKITRIMNQYQFHFYRIIQKHMISREKISITLYDEVLVPFKFSM